MFFERDGFRHNSTCDCEIRNPLRYCTWLPEIKEHYLDRSVLAEETGVVADESPDLGPVEEQHEKKKLLEHEASHCLVVACNHSNQL